MQHNIDRRAYIKTPDYVILEDAAELRARVDRYLALSTVPASTFGSYCVSDARFVATMRRGRRITRGRWSRAMDYLDIAECGYSNNHKEHHDEIIARLDHA